jgi:hypothetical protein
MVEAVALDQVAAETVTLVLEVLEVLVDQQVVEDLAEQL